MPKFPALPAAELDLAAWLSCLQNDMETVLDDFLPPPQAQHDLHDAMRYSVLGGGKRMRALLALATAELCQTPLDFAWQAAAALECMHAYSLIHDDLPAMDNDDMRRGRPSCHKQFSEASALLAGDALQTLAFEILAQKNDNISATQQLQALRLLAHAAGANGMCGGQAVDLAAVGKNLSQTELQNMHAMKTGALILASVQLGFVAGKRNLSAGDQQALENFARLIGLAFQVVDDVLDASSDSATLGKTAGKDAANDKPTYVSFMGLDAARDFAQHLLRQALNEIDFFGQDARRLRDLAQYILQRSF